MYRFASVRVCKKNAIAILKENRLWYPIFLLFALAFLSLVGIACLLEAFLPQLGISDNPGTVLLVSYASLLLCGIFLIFPLWQGVRMLVTQSLLCGRLDVEYLLFFLRSRKHYFFSLRRAFRSLVRIHLYLAVFVLLSRLGVVVGRELMWADREACALLVFLFSAFIICLWTVFLFRRQADTFLMDVALLSAPALSYGSLYKLSAVRMKQGRRALCRLNFSFLPHFILSVLLLGVPYIFVIPYYITARACLAYRLITD